MSNATASAKLIEPIIQVARHSQQDPADLFASIGLQPESTAQAGARIPATVFSTLLNELALRTGNPRLTLRIGEATQPRMLGSVGFLMSTAPNLGQAYQALNDYLPLLIEGLHLSLEQHEETVTLVIDLADDGDRPLAEWFLACLHCWTRWLTGQQVPLMRVDFTFTEPPAPQLYEQFFAAEVSFNADRNRLLFAARYLELACLEANEEMQRLHQTFADQLLSSAGRDGALVAQIKSLIRNQLGSGGQALNRQQIASSLNLSLRTMQRKLDQQGTHFQALFDQTRKDLAMQLIQRGDRSFGEISFQLGFSSLSAFQKAFKRWTNLAPGAWRSAQRPRILTPSRSQPRVLSDLIGTTGVDETRFYPLALQLLDRIEDWTQRGLQRPLLSPTRIGITTGDGQDERLTLVDHQPSATPTLHEQLSYQAPEASLALPYAVDIRSELYQLGCLFYCLLHGQPPYVQSDPAALLQAHLQQTATISERLSATLRRILAKLLAVPAEERYQSVSGLQADLQQSRLAHQQQRSLVAFAPGCSDSPPQITDPGHLVGRGQQQLLLAQLLQQSKRNDGRLLLLEGPPGCGKSSLVESLRRPLFQAQGALLSDSFKGHGNDDIELFIALARQRLRHKLTLPDARRAVWAQRLQRQLGAHASLLQPLAPELETLLGAALPSPTLAHGERRPLFIEALAKLFHANREPLVIFLDDLHHASTDALGLMKLIAEQLGQQPLLLVVSYDPDQLAPDTALAQQLEDYRHHPMTVRLPLTPLSRPAIEQLLQTLFRGMTPELTALADWLYQRSGGHASTLAAQLEQLRQHGWVNYLPQQQCWQWQPEALPATLDQDLRTLLSSALAELPSATRELLQWAATIGDPFPLKLLAEIRQDPVARLIIHLWPAQQAGLVRPTANDDTLLEFSHPALPSELLRGMDEERQADIHWLLGDALKRHWQRQRQAGQLQRCVQHLNRGFQLQPRPRRRLGLSRLNRVAARLAERQGNLELAGLRYQQARELLRTHDRQSQFAAELLLEGAERARRCGDLDVAEQWLTELSNGPQQPLSNRSALPLALATSKLQQQRGQLPQAAETLCMALTECGIRLAQGSELMHAALNLLLSDNGPSVAPPARATTEAVTELLIQLQRIAERSLQPTLNLGATIALVQHGREHPGRPIALAQLQWQLLGQADAARSLAPADSKQMAPNGESLEAGLRQLTRLSPWFDPLQRGLAQMATLLDAARDAGEQEIADLYSVPYYHSRCFSGEPLGPLLTEVEAEQARLDLTLSPDCGNLADSATLLLRGLTASADTAAVAAPLPASPLSPLALAARCALSYLLDQRSQWPELLSQVEAAQPRLEGLYAQPQLLLFATLMDIELALQGGIPDARVLIRCRRNQALLQYWASVNPQGLKAHSALLDAEMAQLDGNSAETGYERALQMPRGPTWTPLLAISAERFALYCRRRGQMTLCRLLETESQRHYRAWGATAKLETDHR